MLCWRIKKGNGFAQDLESGKPYNHAENDFAHQTETVTETATTTAAIAIAAKTNVFGRARDVIVKYPNWTVAAVGVVVSVVTALLLALPSTRTAGWVVLAIPCNIIGYFCYIAVAKLRHRLRCNRDPKISSTIPTHAGNSSEDDDKIDQEFLTKLGGLPEIFTYERLRVATQDFSHLLGKGGFGSVYEGTLPDADTKIAVKCLDQQKYGRGRRRREFCAEVAAMAGVKHANLLRLLGICVDGPHPIMVWDHMPNTSLDRWILGAPHLRRQLTWRRRQRISVDVARALAYLHDGAAQALLHLDVKPHNVLLDAHFGAHLADFGMARSVAGPACGGILTWRPRGTPGYMAPEWVLNNPALGGVTAKADVFSFGMLLLELLAGRRAVRNSGDDHEHHHHEHEQQWFFPVVVIEHLRRGGDVWRKLVDVECHVEGEVEWEQILRALKTAVWCIQGNPAMRPCMAAVLKSLQGHMQLLDPPPVCTIPFAPSSFPDTLFTPLTSFQA